MAKICILYFSKTGKTKEMAEVIAEGATEAGAEVKTLSIEDALPEDINDCDAVIFGTPTYYANICWQIKKWFDEPSKNKLEGKLGAAYATADYVQGGADTAIMNIVGHMLVKGMMVYSGGSALGQPYLHLGAVIVKDRMETRLSQAEIFGERIAKKAADLFAEGVD